MIGEGDNGRILGDTFDVANIGCILLLVGKTEGIKFMLVGIAVIGGRIIGGGGTNCCGGGRIGRGGNAGGGDKIGRGRGATTGKLGGDWIGIA